MLVSFSRTWLCVGTAFALLWCSGCKRDKDDEDDDTTTTGDDGSYWYVGKDGSMFRVDPAGGDPSTYALETDADLLAIACRGAEEAWVVGESGTVLFTFDGGDSWEKLDLEHDESLGAVAVDQRETVWIAGEDGSILRTPNVGEDWEYLVTPARPWTGLTTDAWGEVALLAAADGTIWRHDGEQAELLFEASEPLTDIAVTPNGLVAVAVGEEGTMIESRDGGKSWTRVPLDTARDLEAVQVSWNGKATFAVGEAGVVVRLGEHGNTIEELLPAELSLRDLHLSADHAGHVLGDAGTALLTWDLGASWEPIELGTLADLTALDQLHAEPHL